MAVPAPSDAGAYWLVKNPPVRPQYRQQRGALPSGLIVLHSTESVADVHPPDRGAEAVSEFIRTRDEAGSYHGLADQDSTVELIPPWFEAFHCGTHKVNRYGLGYSVAWQAHKASSLPVEYRSAAIRNLAVLCARGALWLKAEFGIVVPAERISVADAVARRPGFVTHGMLDPNRRSDPDNTKTGEAFPWDEFFGYFRAEMGAPITALSQEDQDIMYLDIVREIYEAHGRGGPKDRRAMHIWAFDLAANAGNLNSVARQTEIIDYIDYKLGGGK